MSAPQLPEPSGAVPANTTAPSPAIVAPPHARTVGDAAGITGRLIFHDNVERQSVMLGTLSADQQHLLQQLRTMILDDPDPHAGIAATNAHLRNAESDPSWRAWLGILMAEAHQRNASYWAAGNYVRGAAEQVQAHQLAPQALVASGTRADLAVCERHPGAVSACTEYLQAAQHAAPMEPAEQATHRFALASVLRAIAVYHHESCQLGRRQLEALLPAAPNSGRKPLTATVIAVQAALAPMVTATLAAMDEGCRPSCLPPPTPLPPLPGGVLLPQFIPVAVDFGANRVTHPGAGPRKVTHACAFVSTDARR